MWFYHILETLPVVNANVVQWNAIILLFHIVLLMVWVCIFYCLYSIIFLTEPVAGPSGDRLEVNSMRRANWSPRHWLTSFTYINNAPSATAHLEARLHAKPLVLYQNYKNVLLLLKQISNTWHHCCSLQRVRNNFMSLSTIRKFKKLTLSKPGSLWYGFSVIRLWMDISTLDSVWAGLQAGPAHVLENN